MEAGMLRDGRWEGWYSQDGQRYPQGQEVLCADGILRGEGEDLIGPFVLEGEYVMSGPRAGRVGWVKTYVKAHSVLYLGAWDGEMIAGTWEIHGSGGSFGFRPPAGWGA